MSEEKTVTFGRFVWHDLIAADQEKAIKFYTDLFGWETEGWDMGDQGTYTMFKAGGQTMGGFMNPPAPEVPPHWQGYVQVENIEETAARVENNGGKLLSPIIDIPEVGKAVSFQDPSGGVASGFQAVKPFSVAPDYRPPELSVCWNELVSTDPEASAAFYTEVFGWNSEKTDMGGGFDYYIFSVEGMQVAGLMQAPPTHRGPTMWLAHVYVDSLSETLNKAKELGANIVMEPQTIPNVGSFFLFCDPFGAFINAFEPTEEMKEC